MSEKLKGLEITEEMDQKNLKRFFEEELGAKYAFKTYAPGYIYFVKEDGTIDWISNQFSFFFDMVELPTYE